MADQFVAMWGRCTYTEAASDAAEQRRFAAAQTASIDPEIRSPNLWSLTPSWDFFPWSPH
ncbi:MAG: hypothetical protein KBG15_14200 [Kofleriaceae bacterium]|nr:hypothetical protein [Kofleriaceae bacterium]